MLKRDQHAEVAGRRIDRSDECDEQDRRNRFNHRKDKPRNDGHSGSGQEQPSEIITRRDEADQQRQRGRSKQ
jgi:hypothetical protein